MTKIKIVPQTRLPGFVDLVGEDVKKEQEIVRKVTEVYETFGYVPLETPPIESMKVLGGKGGEETQKLLYRGEDSSWAIRFDLTVPFASFVAYNANQLPDPFKRWQYGFVARGERAQVKKGRLRGFKQLDLDCVSTTSNNLDDVDVVAGMVDTMLQFTTIQAQVRINDRRVLDGLADKSGLGVGSEKAAKLLAIIDKFDKVGEGETLKKVELNFGQDVKKIVASYLKISGTYTKVTNAMEELLSGSTYATEGILSLREIGQTLTEAGYSDTEKAGWIIDPKIARGLDYYTGPVFETVVIGYEDRGSVFSGGRYDNLVEKLGGPKRAAVGASVGVSRLLGILEDSGEFKDISTGVQVTIAGFPDQKMGELLALARNLRQAGISTEISSLAGKPLGKQFKQADSRGSRFVVILGDEEKAKGVVKLKVLETGQQMDIKLANLSDSIKKL